MALPVLEGIASVFGAAVPAYQQARNFVLESQQAALDYRIAVANLITRLRAEELANAARMRAAAADAISDVRRRFAIGSPEYQAVVAQLRNSNVPQEQQDAFLGSLNAQGYVTEDQVELAYDLTKGDSPEDVGGAGGRGQDDYALTEDYFKTEITNLNSQITSNLSNLRYFEQQKESSDWDNLSPPMQTWVDQSIEKLNNERQDLINDQRQLFNSRDYVMQKRSEGRIVSLDEVKRLFPISRYPQEESSEGTGTPVVTPDIPVDPFPINRNSQIWPSNTYGPRQNQGMSPQDSSRVRGSVEVVRPQF